MIGVFDSGYGGLTILHAFRDRLPRQAFVYLGDHANAPYGCRPSEEVIALTQRNVEALFQRGCRLVVLACNTAAAVALRHLQQVWLPAAYPEHRILGILVPMVETVTGVPWACEGPPADHPGPAAPGSHRPALIGVFGTRRTVMSNAYAEEIGKRAPAVRIVQQACPDLAAAIEGHASPAEIDAMIRSYVASFLAQTGGQAPDSVILGCTHYQLVAERFAAALPPGAALYNQPAVVAESLADYLARHPEFAASGQAEASPALLTTGEAGRVSARAREFLGTAALFAAAG